MSNNIVETLILIIVDFREVVVEIVAICRRPISLIIERRLLVILLLAVAGKLVMIRRFWAHSLE